jgi:tRNA(Ile)-lysidine synthase
VSARQGESSRPEDPDGAVRACLLRALSRLDPDARAVVAYSGGLDSTVLLHAVSQHLGPARLVACHVNHGLQPLADDWARHCEAQALSWGLGFRLLRLGAAQASGQGLEAWARTERYRVLWQQSAAEQASVLLTAHHADDDAETLLMRLARGAGLEGLAGGVAPEQAGPAGMRLLRPFVSLRREVLAAYAQGHGLSYVDDPMNTDEAYFRVAIRREVMPVLSRVAPAFVTNAARARRLLGQAQTVLQEVAQSDLAAAIVPRAADEPPALDRVPLRALSPARRAWVARLWLQTLHSGAPTQAQLQAWLQQMVDATSAGGECRLGGRIFMRYRDCIEAWPGDCPIATPARGVAASASPPPDLSLEWSQPEPLPSDTARLSAGHEPLRLQGWHGGLRVHAVQPAARVLSGIRLRVSSAPGELRVAVAANRPHRTLRKWWQERGVPSAVRPWLPMVSDEQGRVLYVAGLGMVRGDDDAGADPLRSLRLAFEPELSQDPRRPFVRSE